MAIPDDSSPSAFFVSDGDRYLPTRLTKGPWGASLSGNYVGGLLGRSIEGVVDDPGLQAARVTVDLLRPVAPHAVCLEATTIRHGRRMQLIDAVMTQNQTLVARASALFLRQSEQGTGTVWTSPINMPAPPQETGALFGDGPMFMWSYGRDPVAGAPGIGLALPPRLRHHPRPARTQTGAPHARGGKATRRRSPNRPKRRTATLLNCAYTSGRTLFNLRQ
jgi:acyl-coenzyme A thioesterase PaaI-like protein